MFVNGSGPSALFADSAPVDRPRIRFSLGAELRYGGGSGRVAWGTVGLANGT